jgi:hypothetical protein
MKLEEKYFVRFNFTEEQVNKNLANAHKDLSIAKIDKIREVKFNYAYSALIKAGIALLSYYQARVKSAPGHHVKIIEKLALLLKDENIAVMGNVMRAKRNLDLYAGGVEITDKECRDYVNFTECVIHKVNKIIHTVHRAGNVPS